MIAQPGCVAVLHGEVAAGAEPDAQDTLTQVREVAAALTQLGFRPEAVPVSLRLDRLRERLEALRPQLAFNLVEAVAEHDGLLAVAPLLLEALAIPYTGASASALVLTGDKLEAKRLLGAAGIPVPQAWDTLPDAGAVAPGVHALPADAAWIVKSVWQQASFGLDDHSVVRGADAVAARLRERRARLGGAWYVERYIPGREFNLSLLQSGAEVVVLPPAEIRFEGFPAGKPRIVGYAAKWHPDTPEYRGTVRGFDFPPADAGLLDALRALALRCWHTFGLRGYARVDLRVDAEGRPWVLEANANPCLSADAGFVAAAQRAGLSQADVVARIVASTAAGTVAGTVASTAASTAGSPPASRTDAAQQPGRSDPPGTPKRAAASKPDRQKPLRTVHVSHS